VNTTGGRNEGNVMGLVRSSHTEVSLRLIVIHLFLVLLTGSIATAAVSDETAIPGLDSLTATTLVRALDYLDLKIDDLGFDKLYVEDDTFRLGVIDELLNNPIRIPGWQVEVTGELRAVADQPAALAAIMGRIIDTSLGSDNVPSTYRLGVLGTTDAADTGGNVDEVLDRFVDRCNSVEYRLAEGFARITAEERNQLLMLAPAVWGDWELASEKARKGALHFEAGAAVDTTIEISDELILDLAAKIDRDALTRGTVEFFAAVTELAGEILHRQLPWPTLTLPGVEGAISYVGETPWGQLVIGGPGDTHYTEAALSRIAFIIEPGGNDTYRGRTASAIGDLTRPLSAVIDFEGDDLYEARERSYALGGAVLGVAALIDLAGDDVYRGDDGVLGAGFFGSGLLYDGGGVDLFEGRNLSQGAGAFGLGLLISDCTAPAPSGPELEPDRAFDAGFQKVRGTGFKPIRYDDNDTYLCARQSQGFASTFGIGLLYDRAGSDTYKVGGRYLHAPLLPNDFQSLSQGFSIGFRPRAGGGVGILMDEEGNDFYSAEVYAQGVGYWYSMGLLFDGGGNDSYHATQYAQGAGVHLAIGSLWDVGGDDHYVSKFGVTQGTAHDLSVGMLLDQGGNDFYIVSGGQAMSITNSVAIFIDEQGDDFYGTPDGGQGLVTWARGFCGAGIFLDLEGKDTYLADMPAGNGTVWSQRTYGIGIDLDRKLSLPGDVVPEVVLTAEDSLRTVEELFETASIWEVGSARHKVRTARKALIAKGMPAVEYVVAEKLETQSGLEFRAITELARAYPDSITVRLLPLLEDENEEIRRSAIRLLGTLKREEAVSPMRKMLKNKKYKDQWNRIIGALGGIGDLDAAPDIRLFLKADSERRRIAAINGLRALKDTTAVPALVTMLEDPVFTVRSAASNGLKPFRAAAIDPLCDRLLWNDEHGAADKGDALPRGIQIRTLGDLTVGLRDSTDRASLAARARARKTLMGELDKVFDYYDHPGARAAAVDALIRLEDEETRRFVALRMVDEFDPLVKRMYEKAMEATEKN
jgi:HEAT repeats